MKQSKRLLLRTAAALYCLMGLYVGATRAFMDPADEAPRAPRRTPVEELAALRDFNEIEMESDVSVEVVQQADYSIELIGFAQDRGDLLAVVEQGRLHLRGYGNSEEASVRVGMPELEEFRSGFSPLLTITGFSGEELYIAMQTRPARTQKIELRQNDFANLEVRVFTNAATVELEVDRASFSNGIDIIGGARVTISD